MLQQFKEHAAMTGLQISALPRLLSSAGRRVVLDLVVLWILRRLWRRILPSLIRPSLIRPSLSVITSLPSKESSKAFEEQFDLSCPGSPKGPISSGRALLQLKALPQVSRNSGRDSDAWSETSEEVAVRSTLGAQSEPRWGDHKLVLVMVGLPARGKSYITQHLKRYLTFEGFGVRVFNAGDYRRKVLGAGQCASFYDPENEEGRKQRRQLSNACLDDLLLWLRTTQSAHVGILDATNSTAERREGLLKRCSAVSGIRVAFLESICTNEEVLAKNYEMKLKNADYAGWDEQEARRDFLKRTMQYEKLYETIDDSEGNGNISFMKILNCGQKMVQTHCEGYLVSKVASYMLNLHIAPRVIYLTRHGMSEDNATEKLGGDSKLTKEGMNYARRLGDFMREQLGWTSEVDGDASRRLDESPGWLLVTSQLKRARQTARPLVEDAHFVVRSGMRRVHTALLNEIAAGLYDGYSVKEFEQLAPKEHKAREKDKLRYRYPMGESYLDLVQRVKPVAFEIERERRPALVIAHQAVLRTIIAFFQGTPLDEMPKLKIPLHTVLQLTITPHCCEMKMIPIMEGPHLRTASSSDSVPESVNSSAVKTSVGHTGGS